MKTRVVLALVGTAAAALLLTQVVLAQRPLAFDLKFGSLAGTKELNKAGDPDGVGTASGTLVEPDTLCYGLTVKNIGTPVAAHVHKGLSHENGPIVIPLTPPKEGNPGTSSACVSGISPELMDDIRRRPSKYYWNVHTTDHPGGAVRGQLFNAR